PPQTLSPRVHTTDGEQKMNVRSRLRALEQQRRQAELLACPRCRHAFPLEEHPATLPPLPSFEELQQLPYANLLRMYHKWNYLDGTRPAHPELALSFLSPKVTLSSSTVLLTRAKMIKEEHHEFIIPRSTSTALTQNP